MIAVHYAGKVRVNGFLNGLLSRSAVLIMRAFGCFAMSRHGGDRFEGSPCRSRLSSG